MLVASRLIAHVPIPGADLNALQRVFQTNQLAGFFDLFSGGALSSLSVAALGVYPYITAQIIMQIMQPAITQPTSAPAVALPSSRTSASTRIRSAHWQLSFR
jgi:preprotein translocase subunit SecY